jgi:hypothetical protein
MMGEGSLNRFDFDTECTSSIVPLCLHVLKQKYRKTYIPNNDGKIGVTYKFAESH